MKFFKDHGVFIFIFFLCCLLRFIPLFDYQFTFDELSGLDRTQFKTFAEVIEKGVKIDAHPALTQLMIFYLTRFFGYVNWAVKLPFLILSLGTLLYAYLFGVRNFSKQSGIFASLIFAFSLIFVFYAPIARMYMPGVFFSLGLLYYFFEIFFETGTKVRNYAFFGLFALLSALNHHINSLFAFTVCVSGLFFLNKQNYKAYLVTCIVTVLCYLPHLAVTLYQLSVPGIGRDAGGWLEPPEFSAVFSFVTVLFGTGRTYLVFVGLILLSMILKKKFYPDRRQIYLLLIFVFNFLVIYIYSILRSPVFQYSVMMFSATALVLCVSSFIAFKNKYLFYLLAFFVMSTLVYKSYFKKDYLHQAVKTVYEYQFERTAYYKDLYGDKEVYPLFFDCDTLMRNIYFKKYNTKFDLKMGSDSVIAYSVKTLFTRKPSVNFFGKTDSVVSSFKLFSEFVASLPCSYVAISSAMPMYQAIVAEHFPYLLENTQTQAINYKLYSKRKEDKNKVVGDDKCLKYSNVKDPQNFSYAAHHIPFVADTAQEFAFETKAIYRDVVSNEGQVVLVRTSVGLYDQPSDKLECCIMTANKESGEPYSYSSKSASDFLLRQDSTVTMYSDIFIGSDFWRAKNKSVLKSYFWNRGKAKFRVNDFEIKVIDYWPQKWHYWD